jgi:hypothetical protein
MPIVILRFVEGLLGPKLAQYAKPLIYLVLALLLVGTFGVAKCSYDKRIVAAANSKQEAATAKADKKADNHAADSRVVDITREQDEKVQTQGAIDNAKRNGTDPRDAGQPSPRC